jgi:ribonuclease P protein component
MDEAHVSAERAQAGQNPWVPQAHVEQSRPGDHSVASGQGSPSTVGVSVGRAGSRPARWGVRPVRHRRTFDRLRHSPDRGRSGPASVGFVRETSWSRVEIAYVIGRRVGTAVTRNRLRRRLRAIVADPTARLPTGAYVIHVAPSATQLGFDELKAHLSRAVERAVAGHHDHRSPAAAAGARGSAG